MNNTDNDDLLKRAITYSRLPEIIRVNGKFQTLEYSHELDTVARYYVGYSSQADFPRKEVFLFYEESTPELCIMKAWRKLAEHKNEWQPVETMAEV
jgi:hypothetical protein